MMLLDLLPVSMARPSLITSETAPQDKEDSPAAVTGHLTAFGLWQVLACKLQVQQVYA